MSLRAAPVTYAAAGAIPQVTDAAILANADPLDRDGDGVYGRARLVRDAHGSERIGAVFGWGAGQARLEDQISSALAEDMGLTAEEFPAADVARLSSFVMSLGIRSQALRQYRSGDVPRGRLRRLPPREPRCRGRRRGHSLFRSPAAPDGARAQRRDGRRHGQDQGNGAPHRLSDRAAVWASQRRYLHDGRAASVGDAILWHDGEARRARDAFLGLDEASRQRLIAFVQSL